MAALQSAFEILGRSPQPIIERAHCKLQWRAYRDLVSAIPILLHCFSQTLARPFPLSVLHIEEKKIRGKSEPLTRAAGKEVIRRSILFPGRCDGTDGVSELAILRDGAPKILLLQNEEVSISEEICLNGIEEENGDKN